MDAVLRFLAENGAMLLAGVTPLLGLGCAGGAICRSPAHRQRVCETALVVALGWAVLACVPLPRVNWGAKVTPPARGIPVGRSSLLASTEIPPGLIARPPKAAVPDGDSHERIVGNVTGGADPHGWAAVAYLGGSVACIAWLAIGYGVIRRVVRHAEPAPAEGREWAQSCAGGLPVKVLVSARVAGPLTFGAWRPVILLPAGLLSAAREGQLRQVLRHEVAHVLRRDGWGNLLFCLALPALYVHPCYWWLRRRAEMARELVADDWAARADGKEAYAGEMVALARSRANRVAGMTVGGIGMLRRRSAFYRRMRMLLQRSEPLATRCSKTWRALMGVTGVAVVAVATSLAGVGPTGAQELAPVQPPALAEQPVPTGEPPAAAQERRELEAQIQAVRERLADLERRLAAANKVTAASPGRPAPTPDQEQTIEERMRARREREREQARLHQTEPEPRPQALAGSGAGGGMPMAVMGGSGSGSGVGGVQLDLVNLANSLVDATGAFKQAQIALDAKAKLSKSGAYNALELAEARARLETAQKRVELLRSIAKVAMESAKLNYARLKQLNSMGMVDNQVFDEATSKLKMLEVIVKGAE